MYLHAWVYLCIRLSLATCLPVCLPTPTPYPSASTCVCVCLCVCICMMLYLCKCIQYMMIALHRTNLNALDYDGFCGWNEHPNVSSSRRNRAVTFAWDPTLGWSTRRHKFGHRTAPGQVVSVLHELVKMVVTVITCHMSATMSLRGI